MFVVILTAKCAKIANKKGSVPCRSEAVRGRVQEEGFPSPSGWEPRAVKEEEALVRTLRVVRGSCFSSRVFVVILTAKCAKIAKACMACFSSFVPFALFAVHGIQVVSAIDSNRERRENREQKRECLRKPLIHSQKGLPKGICPKSRATGVFSLSPILPPVVAQNLRKFVLVCFSMFASFALFAVHVFQLECSLSF